MEKESNAAAVLILVLSEVDIQLINPRLTHPVLESGRVLGPGPGRVGLSLGRPGMTQLC